MNHIRLHEDFPMLPGLRARAVIDTAALAENYHTLMTPVRAVSPHTMPIAVVKADAYGHGIRPVVTTLFGEGCRFFAVACLEEAVALRRLLRELMAESDPRTEEDPDSRADILVLGYTAPQNASILAKYAITAALLSEDHANRLEKCARDAGVRVKVHAALDTGMNRIGYPAHTDGEIADTVETLAALFGGGASTGESALIPDGLFTHFARADEDFDTEMNRPDSVTMTQYTRYRRVLEGLCARGITPRICHVCNSAAAIRFPHVLPEGCMDAVRLGISLYGYGVDIPQAEGTTFLHTKPVMKLETLVTHVHTLHPGETAGYGGTFASHTPRTLATLPIGYADGWIRDFSGASVTFHTEDGDMTAPIVGRVCMDQCMADVTDLPITVGTRVTLFGETSHQLEALARRANTITYELLCLITARIPRVYHQ